METVLTTERLRLRPLQVEDAPHIVELAGNVEVAKMTLNIPHPYPAESAMDFIKATGKNRDAGTGYTFAIARKADDTYMGTIGIHPTIKHLRAEVGYWMGVPYWGQGYMTEALKRIIQFGFDDLKLNRVQASYRVDNPASGRVMEKAGMKLEGTFYKYYIRDHVPMDLHFRAILREEYDAQNS